MSSYAHMKNLVIHRDITYKSPTTGQERVQETQQIPFKGEVVQITQADVNSNERRYNKAGYFLTTYRADIREGDRIVDGDKAYTVQFPDMERRRGPFTAELERMTADA